MAEELIQIILAVRGGIVYVESTIPEAERVEIIVRDYDDIIPEEDPDTNEDGEHYWEYRAN